ncbi:hypothetical protein R1flu_015697 [Riccia fluitans]|uniref:Uncharacterized protein n=1 Tax=Riccia fluitans TaxID=41844 RepID=A0ABD1YK63_9MARC
MYHYHRLAGRGRGRRKSLNKNKLQALRTRQRDRANTRKKLEKEIDQSSDQSLRWMRNSCGALGSVYDTGSHSHNPGFDTTPNVAVPGSTPAQNVAVPVGELTPIAIVYLQEKALLDRLVELSRPETMNLTLEEERAAREVLQDPRLPSIAPGETLEPSMAWYTEQTIALIKNWVQEKADNGESHRVDGGDGQTGPIHTTGDRPHGRNKNREVAELKGQLEMLRQAQAQWSETWIVLRQEEPDFQDLPEDSSAQDVIDALRREVNRVQEEYRRADEVWKTQAKVAVDEMKEIIAQNKKNVESQNAERARWQKNDARIAEFMRQANKSRDEFRAKDELMKNLLRQLRE